MFISDEKMTIFVKNREWFLFSGKDVYYVYVWEKRELKIDKWEENRILKKEYSIFLKKENTQEVE